MESVWGDKPSQNKTRRSARPSWRPPREGDGWAHGLTHPGRQAQSVLVGGVSGQPACCLLQKLQIGSCGRPLPLSTPAGGPFHSPEIITNHLFLCLLVFWGRNGKCGPSTEHVDEIGTEPMFITDAFLLKNICLRFF